MIATYWQKGETIDYTPKNALKNGEVVDLGTRIGISGTDYAAGEPGHLHVVGVFRLSKAAEAIEVGANVYYDADNDNISTNEDDTPAGWAIAPASAADATVLVKLLG